MDANVGLEHIRVKTPILEDSQEWDACVHALGGHQKVMEFLHSTFQFNMNTNENLFQLKSEIYQLWE